MNRTLLLFSAALLAACGSRSSGTIPGTGSAAISGTVVELDGQTADRSGVAVTVAETGETVMTGPDGSFRFDSVPTGTVTLDLGAQGSGTRDDNEDGNGSRIIRGVEDGADVEIRCSLDKGIVTEFSRSDGQRVEAEVKAERDGIEAEVEVESRLDDEKFEVELKGLAPGTAIDILTDDPSDSADPVRLATVFADSTGKAELELETKQGDSLPGGATSVADLEGLIVILEDADTGEELFRLEVPTLPDMPSTGGAAGSERMRGKAKLAPSAPGVEGQIELRTRPEKDEQRFKMEAEHLAIGDEVRFEIEDPDSPGSFLLLATAVANLDGGAEISTRDGLALPLGVTDVEELVGLEVRVVRSGTTILSGTVPALVRD